jgi:hypothetical protein
VQYWNDLEKLHEQVNSYQKMQEERIAKALRIERDGRMMVEKEIVGKVTRIRNDM